MTSGFTAEQKRIIIWRDGGKCCMCGRPAEVANHRLNRGMGGRRSLNILENGCALCWACNDLIERDPDLAAKARELGVKLTDGQDPRAESWLSPFYRLRVWSLENGDLVFTNPTLEAYYGV
jgi:hypothetical protein